MSTRLEAVEAASGHLVDTGKAITFTAVAEHAGISRTTLYRNSQLRAVVEDHQAHSHDRHTLTGLAAEIEVVDPRNASLFFLLVRDFWRYRVGVRTALATLARIPVQAVVVNGRIVARGEWPETDEVLAMLGRGRSPSPVR